MDTAAPEQCLCKRPLHFGSLCLSMCVMFAVLNSSTSPQHAFNCSHPQKRDSMGCHQSPCRLY